MQNNRFYQNRARIQAISKERNLTVSEASRALAVEKGWEQKDYIDEINAWDQECIKFMRHPTKTLADLFK